MSGPAPDGSDVLVVVPTYDERESLPGLVRRLLDTLPGLRILVVDDGSPDGTGALAETMAAVDPRVGVHHHAPRAGLGAAYVDAFCRVLDGGLDADGIGWIVQMDADGSHAPEELPRLLAAADEADVVIGSRYVRGGATEGWPAHRRLLSRAGNVYSRRLLGLSLHDVTGGFRCFRRAALAELGMATVASQGYCFQVDVAFRVQRAGLRVREVPITFVEREHGESKMSGAVVREALWRITSWGVRDQVRRRRARPRRR
ncbi:polyprenol monophosphomannose synthase [Actinomycetospora cinnamomea]|uniref:Dolichol-phosphate mannosyltransferase n=1 Tax=Actinomycetospora cinnamomea TaxID=663609 RepID=A0A2U1EU04_9PSEU|nr:polyprenol monophosphomannose synthase [Actinomycetospora cinnamomea]PVZ03414.1 dolichol-phosphate mannosyltransferase [Actinomycetospora cinnamomea]